MKKKLFFGFLALSTAGIFTTSCSDSEDEKDNQQILNPGDPTNPGDGNNTVTNAKYQHKVLLEDITGTWCPACPSASSAIAQAKANAANGDKIVAAVIHIGRSDYADPMQISDGTTLYTNFFVPNYGENGVFSFPTITINRGNTWNRQGIAQFFNAINTQGSPVGIKISSNLTNTGGTINASFKFSQGYENLKYGVYVIEQDVKTADSPQAGSSGTTGGANYVHKDVVRAIPGGVNNFEVGAITAGQEINKSAQNVSYQLFNNDLSKVDVIVYVADAQGKVLNVQTVKANQTVNYQTLN